MAVFSGLVLTAARADEPAPDALKGLLSNSPFGSRPTAGEAGASATPLELRGVFVDHGEPFFSLYETSTRTARWVGLNEAGNPFTVRRYDLAQGVVTVEYQGREFPLGLKQAKVVALPPAPPLAVAATGPGPIPAPPAAKPGTPAEEAARMAAIAQEIARRRAMRARPMTPEPAGPTAPPR